MLVYWVPLVVVLSLRAFRSHFRVLDEGGFVTMTPLSEVHPALDRAIGAVTGRAALVGTVLFGLLTTAIFALVIVAAASSGVTPNYCLHHVLVP